MLGLFFTALLTSATLPLAAGTAHAEPADQPLAYTCTLPLVGNQPATALIDVNVPEDITAGEPATIRVEGVLNLSPISAEAMRLVGATSIEGTVRAQMTVHHAGGEIPLEVPLPFPEDPTVPTSATAPLVLPVDGSYEVTIPEPGPASVVAGDLSLTLTPRNASGSPTGLGTFTSSCVLTPGQNAVLAEFDVAGGPPPGTVLGSYTCLFPLIGESPVTVAFRPQVPDTVSVGQNVSFDTPVTVTYAGNIHQAFALIGTPVIDSSGAFDLAVDGPGGEDRTLVGTSEFARINASLALPFPPLVTTGTVDAESVRFTTAGPAQLSAGELRLTVTLRRADGDIGPLETFRTTCSPVDGLAPVLAEFEVIRGGS
ncbi:hypothetical protein RM780_24305 [Streptomyces sp. DSM 44917]|uniref:DUF6801 domain-containing protein n=1 Tax=Streptomyces boetiae TaxID=3075541 RepID=A0ABU2LEN7_9ACTN|nr:DUF6801 domain-containing protein [Streptomyces sp. DSM 44917]MDT0310052.1 hypothetical protein [Streptomyces sp. DSM 44917]